MKPRHLVGVLICALLLAYLLSIGPVAAWYMDAPFRANYRSDSLEPVRHNITNFYAPVLWLKNQVPPLQSALSHYVHFWMSIDGNSGELGQLYVMDEIDWGLLGFENRIFGPSPVIPADQILGLLPRNPTSEMEFPSADQQGPPAPRVIIEDHKSNRPPIQP